MAWQDKIRNPDCELCPLHEDAEHVCLMGTGPKKAKVMVVGEAPGEREDEAHRAFVGPSGRYLRDSLVHVGVDPEECYISNVAKCRPPGNRTPDWSEIKICRDAYFWQEWETIQPDYVLALGNSALRAITGRARITHNRGSTFEVRGAVVLATFHPAYVLRSPYHQSAYSADLAKFGRLVNGSSQGQTDGQTRVRVVRSRKGLERLARELSSVPVISYDLETNYWKKHHEAKEWWPTGQIVSISFSWEVGKSVVVPLHHPETPWKNPDAVLRYLKSCLERRDAKYVAHNGKFDCRWLAAKAGIFVPQTFDTMLAAHMLEENRLKGLEPLSEILLGIEPYKISVGDIGAQNVPLRKLCKYNAQDTDYTLRLYFLLKEQMKQEPRIARVFAKLMMPASNAMTPVEMGGVWIDPERYTKRLKKTIRKRDRVESTLRTSCGNINLRSPQQVGKWLFSDPTDGGLGLPIIERTRTKAPSTNERVILRLARSSPELRKLLEYRTLETKYIRTYFAQWSHRDENSRFHPEYKLFGTVTGRLSGDFQQVPRDPFMRSIVGAPPGWVFVEADYSQIELRLAAWIANERRLLRLFAEGADAHLNTAVEITGKRPEDITIEERKHGKSVNFGFLYSMGPKKFVEYAFQHYELVISLAQAQEYYDKFHRSYPALRKWHDRQRRLVHRYERVHSPIGRVRHLPTVRSSDSAIRLEAERQAINSPVQSLASDLMLLSFVRLHSRLPHSEARIVGTVHDSILFEVRERFLQEALPIIRETMMDLKDVRRKFGCHITVPIEVEVKYGAHWGETQKFV